uniref:Cell division protein FtsQ n=1 Tax=Candidatus Kentrum sp. DK TaxID=2126562 RepID=A0A450RUF5_9GAMM|nr:MAG: cell division protein FtsQ [Candidatus Kentron sp. DK]
MRSTHRIRVLLAALGVAALGGCIYILPAFLYVPISHVRVAGELREITEVSLREAVSPHLASGFFGLDVTTVRESVLKLPWLKSVSVRRIWPESLHIAVIEHKAEARWQEGGLIATDGTLFQPPPESYPKGLPILEGMRGTHAEMLGQYRKLQQALEPIGRKIHKFVRTKRPIWRIELDTGLSIIVGDEKPIAAVAQFARTTAAVLGERIENMLRVDLRYANGFAVRWRPAPPPESDGSDAEDSEQINLLLPPEISSVFPVE